MPFRQKTSSSHHRPFLLNRKNKVNGDRNDINNTFCLGRGLAKGAVPLTSGRAFSAADEVGETQQKRAIVPWSHPSPGITGDQRHPLPKQKVNKGGGVEGHAEGVSIMVRRKPNEESVIADRKNEPLKESMKAGTQARPALLSME